MTIISRDYVLFNEDSDVSANSISVFQAPVQPNGEVWQILRIIFADKNIGDNISGGFLVDFGTGGTREIIAQAFLTGDTCDKSFQRETTGDGVKRLRIIRENNSLAAKKMVCMVEAIKKI